MKTIICFIIFVLPIHIFSQNNNQPYNHEVGINFLNLFNRHQTIESKLLDEKQTITKINIINGIYYRYHKPQYSLNAFFNFYHTKPFKDKYVTEILEINSKYIEYCFGAGLYKYLYRNKPFTFYFGADFEINNSYLTREQGGGITDAMRDYETKKLTFGLSPVLGLRYRLTKRLSISLEASLNINYYVEKIYINQDDKDYKLFNSHRFETRFNSIKVINVGYHF